MINENFFKRNAKKVAVDLLGKLLIRKINGKKVGGIIVETEAYYGENDPASRAFIGKKNMNRVMWECPGTIFVYMVHSNWMLNFVTGECNDPQAVLIRAIEPKFGIEIMKKNRGIDNLENLTNGPGKLTKALKIDKRFNERSILNCKLMKLKDGVSGFKVGRSHRIGVRKDLRQKLRFFILGNKYVSHGSSIHGRKR